MKPVVNLMINEFKLLEIGIDFMGYRITDPRKLSFHHLVEFKRDGGVYVMDNGAILVRNTSHDYIHLIERVDKKIFNAITDEMKKENKQGSIERDNIVKIDEYLCDFEERHSDDTIGKGRKLLIRDEFLRRYLVEERER